MLFEGGFFARYVPTGHLLVAQEDVLLGMTFDVETLKVGPAVPVVRGLITNADLEFAAYDVSASGSLVYLTGALEKESWLVRLRPGREPERLNASPTNFTYSALAVSPDGGRVALSRNDRDVWIFDLESRHLVVRVTTDPAPDTFPVWEPSGERLTFASQQGEGWSAYSRSADGLGEVRPLIEDRRAQKWPSSWSHDGKVLLFDQFDPETEQDIWTVPAEEPGSAQPFLRTSFDERAASFSPDGKWVAYFSNESGRYEIYVTSYPDRSIRTKVSRSGSFGARWSADGRLFYESGGRVMVVEAVDARWRPSEPELFVTGVEALAWDVTPDGQSVITLERRPPPQLHLVQNWFEELKRLVPVDR